MVDVRGDVLRPPHGTTPAAVMSNKKLHRWKYQAEEQILEPVFMKHYAPNICVHLKMAKFAKGHNPRFYFL